MPKPRETPELPAGKRALRGFIRFLTIPFDLGSLGSDPAGLKLRKRLTNTFAWLFLVFTVVIGIVGGALLDLERSPLNLFRICVCLLVLFLSAKRHHTAAVSSLIILTYISIIMYSGQSALETVGPYSLIAVALGCAYLFESAFVAMFGSAMSLVTMIALRALQIQKYSDKFSGIYLLSLSGVAFFLWLLLFFQRREQMVYQLIIRNQFERLDKQKKSLEDANALKLKMFSVVAHDLRMPMTSLVLLLENMEQNLLAGQSAATVVRGVAEQQKAVHFMIENILEWSRTQLHQIESDPQILPVKWIVQDELSLLRPHAAPKSVEIASSVDDSLRVFADPNMLRFVIRNLVLNALKFSHRGAAVDVRAEADASNVLISVIDRGTGMMPETAARLFKLGGTSLPGTESEAGTGLGLVLCKEFLEKNNGLISFTTEPGKGTTFEVRLPRR